MISSLGQFANSRRAVRRFDARSAARRLRARLSLGWLEDRTAPASLLVNLPGDAGSGSGNSGDLRYCMNIANSNAQDDTITFDPSVTVVNLAAGQIAYTEGFNLTITGPASGNLAINNTAAASATSRIFSFAPVATVNIAISNMTLAGGNLSTGDGGAVVMTTVQNATFTNVVFNNNKTVAGNGGGLSATGASTIALNNCTLSGNSCSLAGGAFRTATASTNVSINGSTFSGNSAGSSGGGAMMFTLGVNIAIDQSNFLNNSTTGPGGAINFNNTVNSAGNPGTITNTVFSGNKAGTTGGGAFRFSAGGAPPFPTATLNLDSCTISGNSTTNAPGGGVILQSAGALSFSNCTLSGNVANTTGASINGGALTATNSGDTVTFTNCTIANNITAGTVGGGGICISSSSFSGQLNLRNSTIVGNSATGGKGGGVFVNSASGTVTLSSTCLAGNVNANNKDIAASALRNVGGDNNLIGAVDPTLSTLTGTNNPSLIGTEGTPVVAALQQLGNFGGPTLTMPPVSGSLVIDAGNNAFSLANDQRGTGFPRVLNGTADIGAVEGVLANPFVASNTLVNVSTAGGTLDTFTVTYKDAVGIDVSTVGKGELTVTGPSGYFTAVPTSTGNSGPGISVTVTYQFTPPGGSWDVSDGGVYTVTIAANKVYDTSGSPLPVLPGTVGTFNVGIVGNIVVDNTGDTVDGNTSAGNLTLREAVGISNNSVGGLETISFAPNLNNQTIMLGGTELQITDPVNIQGPGAGLLTISGNLTSRIFNFLILGAGGTGSTISGLTLANGKLATLQGGAIAVNDDVLTLNNDVLTGNSGAVGGGAVNLNASGGSLTVNGCTFTGNDAGTGTGGGISATGNITIQVVNSTFSGNTANVSGGALYSNAGTVSFTGCTISGNVANQSGSGGGGLCFGNSTVTVTNCTLSGNLAPNGAATGGAFRFVNSTTITINNSTIANNSAAGSGGGLAFLNSNAIVTMESTIVAQNNSPASLDVFNGGSGFLTINGDFDLIGAADEANVFFAGPDVISGTNAMPLDAKLGPLAYNGGPTATCALLAGSPAIDAGSNTIPLTQDQRGNTRVVGMNPDIGAYEVQAPAKFASVVINNGAAQRSMVTQVKVSFNQHIGFSGAAAAAFALTRVGDNAVVNLSAAVDESGSGTAVTLTFTGGAVNGPSLADGRYALHILASGFNAEGFDGDGNGTATGSPTDDYAFDEPASPATLDTAKIFRIYGDINGDGTVSASDFIVFRQFFGGVNAAFDFDGDGSVSASDFIQFRLRFGGSI
jgi:hypothetical protein